jgi:hypothetical protein
MNYSIVSHDKVTAAVRPILVKHGIVYYPAALNVAQDGNRTQVQMSVKFCNVDNPDDFIHVESLGYGIDAQDKGPGKAISYAVKYALLKCLGLETGDDPDEVQDKRADFQPANDASKKRAEPLQGPHTSKTALWKAVRAFVHEMHGCGDSDMFEALLAVPDNVALLKQCRRDAPQLLDGGSDMPEDYEPINPLIKRMRADFEMIENNTLRAG